MDMRQSAIEEHMAILAARLDAALAQIAGQQKELDALRAALAKQAGAPDSQPGRRRPEESHPTGLTAPDMSQAAPSSRRRSLLKLTGASAAALVGAGLLAGRPERAEAADGSNLVLGQANTASSITSLTPVSAASPAILLDVDNSSSATTSITAAGVQAIGPAGTTGLIGASNGSAIGYGLLGQSDQGYGVVGVSDTGIDLSASGTGRLLQRPQSFVGSPAGGGYLQGEQLRDSNGDLFVCVASGTPGTWKKVAAVQTGLAGGAINLLPSPIRILDTRPGQPAPIDPGRRLLPGEIFTVQVTGTTVGGISVPAGAVAVIGNLAVTDCAGGGDLRLYPANLSTPPLVSSINYAAGSTVANGVIVGLSSGGALNIVVDVSATDVILDVAGFVR